MSLLGEQILLRAYLRGADRVPHVSTQTLIVQAARRENLAGATVLKGILGFGHHGISQSSLLSLVDHDPLIVEIVDSAAKIVPFIQGPLRKIMARGLLTLERAAVLMYRRQRESEPDKLRLRGAMAPLSTVPVIDPGGQMTSQQNGVLLRVFIGDSDTTEKQPLYEAIVQKARALGLAGATVLRGTEGFGAKSVVHRASLLEMSSDLPIVIELVDEENKINLLLPHLETMVKDGMITMEHVTICTYRS